MKIDEAAFGLAFADRSDAGRYSARETVLRYLAALPAEPEIEGGIPVTHYVAVNARGDVLHGGSNGVKVGVLEEAGWLPRTFGIRRIDSIVPPYTPPAEPVVEGRVVEG